MNNKLLFAHAAVLSANLIYGANYTIAKQVMPEYIQPFGFIFIRVLFTAIVFFMMSQLVTREKVDRSDFIRLLFCAVFGVATNQLLFFKGLDLTSPINASLMMTTNPIMVLLAASILIRENITIRKVGGILAGIAGAFLLLVWNKNVSFSSASARGDLMILINSMSWGIFLIIVKPLMQKYQTITVMKWVFVFGSFMVIPFGWEEFSAIRWTTFDTGTWLAVAYVVVGTTSLAYMLNTFALKNLSPSAVSVYIYLQPLFAALVAIAVGEDRLRVIHLVSALLIFTGVYFASSFKIKEMSNRMRSAKKS